MASVSYLQVRPVAKIPKLGERKGRLIEMPEVSSEEKAAFQRVLDSYLSGRCWRDQMLMELARRMRYRGHKTVVLPQAVIKYTPGVGVHVEAREVIKQPYCPGCGIDVYSPGGHDWDNIFHERPVQTLSCIDSWHSMICNCGAVFKRWEAMPDA